MKRTIEQWKACDPKVMATLMSETAVYFAFADAIADILELHKENEKLKKQLSLPDSIAEALNSGDGVYRP